MKIFRTVIFAFLLLGLTLLLNEPAEAHDYVAYSLREAERRLKASVGSQVEVRNFGGMTRVGALVYDTSQMDLIVVGQVNPGLPAVTIDDLVVALRARLLHQMWPEVSIEKTAETLKTGKQIIRYEGSIANTAFGRDLLEADVLLKRLSLGFLPTEIWGSDPTGQWRSTGTPRPPETK